MLRTFTLFRTVKFFKINSSEYYLVSARKHIKFEIDSFCYLLTFSQVIDTMASNHCKKIKI